MVGTIARPNLLRSWWSQARPAERDSVRSGQANRRGSLDAIVRSNPSRRPALRSTATESSSWKGWRKSPRRTCDAAIPAGADKAPTSPRALCAFDMATGQELWRTAELGPSQDALWTAGGVILATVPENHGTTGSLGSTGPGLTPRFRPSTAACSGRRIVRDVHRSSSAIRSIWPRLTTFTQAN